jgi:adenine deaminase
MYYESMSVLQTEEDFYDLAMAYFRTARSQAHPTRSVPFGTVIRGIRHTQQAAGTELGLRTQLIMCFLRDLPADSDEKGNRSSGS